MKLVALSLDRGRLGTGLLYDSKSGLICTLGGLLEALGVSLSMMDQVGAPANLRWRAKRKILGSPHWNGIFASRLCQKETDAAAMIMSINDSDEQWSDQREKALIDLARELGFELTFTGNFGDIVVEESPREEVGATKLSEAA